MIRHQLVIVGGGLAGLRAAVEAKDAGIDVAILSQVHPGRSHSGAAQGGINAALANNPEGHDDTPEKHAFDTVKGSDYLADQDAVYQMTQDAPPAIFEMEHWGCPFSRYDDGRISQRPFGGAGFPRTCYGADKTGHYLLHTLVEQAYRRTGRDVRRAVRDEPHRRRRSMPRGGRLRHDPRRLRGLRRRRRDHRHRRRRAHLLEHHQRHHLDRLRRRHGLPGRRAAQGHGVRPVPPHRALLDQHPHDRGLPRRGRLPAERPGRALHGALRAQDDGARPARHHGALHLDRDPRGARHRRQGLRLPRPAPPGRGEDRREAARHPRPRHPLRGRRSGHGAGADRAQPALHHGRHRHRRRRRHARCPASTPPASAPA